MSTIGPSIVHTSHQYLKRDAIK